MDTVELKKLNDLVLNGKLGELHQEAFNLRFQHATMQLTNTARIRVVKKSIARIKTILRERELKGAEV